VDTNVGEQGTSYFGVLRTSEFGLDTADIRRFSLRFLQPVRHAHLAVHRRRGGEVLLGLLSLVRAPVELAEAEMAVGDEGAHAELQGQRERSVIVPFGRLTEWWITASMDLAEKSQRGRLVRSLAVRLGERE
jgi:hypothetical protein